MPTINQTLRPFRDYDEKDVINLYAYSGTPVDSTYQILATKGTLVKIVGDGFRGDLDEPIEMLGNYGAFGVSNFVAQRYGTVAKVTSTTFTDKPVGLMLFDTRELDENLIPLKYNPRKAAEMEIALSGQSVPIVTRGIFLYSGVQTGSGTAVTAGNAVYAGSNGGVCTTGTNQVGIFLGTTGTTGSYIDNTSIALIKFSF